MFNFSKFRLPFKDDKVFGILILMVLAIPLAFTIFSYENFETIKYALWLILLGAVLVVSFFYGQVTEPLAAVPHELSYNAVTPRIKKAAKYALLALCLFALLSTVHSLSIINSLVGFYYRFTSSLLFYFLWAALVFLLIRFINSRQFIFLLKILVFDALLVAVVGFFQSTGWGYYDGSVGFIRAPSLLGNPNFSAMFMVCALPFAVLFFQQSRRFGIKIYYGLAIFFIILTNAAFSSRGAIAALVVSFIFSCFFILRYKFSSGYRWAIVVVGIMFLFFSFWFTQTSRPYISNLKAELSDQNVSLRLKVWEISIQGIMRRPLLGVGPGNFHIFFERSRGPDLAGQNGVFDDAHNLYLQMAVTTGLPFALSFVFLLLLGLLSAWNEIKTQKNLLAIASFASIISFMVAAFFTPVSIGCFLILAVVIAGQFIAEGNSRPVQLWAKPLILASGIILIVFGVSLGMAESLFYFGYQAGFENKFLQGYNFTLWAKRINPTNKLYTIYNVSNKIDLGSNEESIVKDIESVKRFHSVEARSYVTASNLYFRFFQKTSKKIYLQRAIDNLEQALVIDRYFSERYGQLGLYYYLLGNTDAAVKNLNIGLGQGNNSLPSLILLAKIYQMQNDRPRALAVLEQAYKFHPDVPQVSYIWKIAKSEPDIRKVPIQVFIAPGSLQ